MIQFLKEMVSRRVPMILFAQTFGYANNRAGQKTLQRLEEDKAIKRTMRGHYKKLVSELPTI